MANHGLNSIGIKRGLKKAPKKGKGPYYKVCIGFWEWSLIVLWLAVLPQVKRALMEKRLLNRGPDLSLSLSLSLSVLWWISGFSNFLKSTTKVGRERPNQFGLDWIRVPIATLRCTWSHGMSYPNLGQGPAGQKEMKCISVMFDAHRFRKCIWES